MPIINKNKKYDPIHIQLTKYVFYRPQIPNHPEIKPGWIANWQLIYKHMFKETKLYSKEEYYPSKQEAEQVLDNYEIKDLLPNLKGKLLKRPGLT